MKLEEKIPGAVTDEPNANTCPTPAKQQVLDFSCQTPTVNGEDLNKLVTGYIVDEMLPISTVDSPSFHHIIEKLPVQHNVCLPRRKTFAAYLDREYAAMEAII